MCNNSDPGLPELTFCMGSSCFSRGNEANLKAVLNYLKENNLKDEIDISLQCCLCRSQCSKGPIIFVNGKEYKAENSTVALELLETVLANKTVV